MIRVKYDLENRCYTFIGEFNVLSIPKFYTSPTMEEAFKSGKQKIIIGALKDYNERQKIRIKRLESIIKDEEK